MAARKGPRLYKKQSGTQREKPCINTYFHASASQICLQNLCGQQQNSPMADPLLGQNLDPKTGPKQRPKEGMKMWSNSGLHFVVHIWTQNGSAIGEFRCCPHMLCKQICDPAAWTWLSTHTFFYLCVPSPVATVKVPLSQPCFDHFLGPV